MDTGSKIASYSVESPKLPISSETFRNPPNKCKFAFKSIFDDICAIYRINIRINWLLKKRVQTIYVGEIRFSSANSPQTVAFNIRCPAEKHWMNRFT